jgi:hypothetical protein
MVFSTSQISLALLALAPCYTPLDIERPGVSWWLGSQSVGFGRLRLNHMLHSPQMVPVGGLRLPKVLKNMI